MKGLIDISIRRRVTIYMFTIAVMLFGVVSFTRLKINLLPELTYPTLTIRTEYSGAAPAEIENLITKPIEEAVGIVKNVQKISSISRSGQSDVVLEFAWGTDMDYAVLEVREKMDSIELPLEVKRPTILRFDPSLDPVIRFGLYREKANIKVAFNEEELKFIRRFADEEIKKELEGALGVAAVKISGGLEDEIQILIDQSKIAKLGLPIETIAGVLRAENINLSGGRLEEGSHQYLIRTLNEFQSVKEIGNVIVAFNEGTPIYLRDIAAIRQGYKERTAITRMMGTEAIEIAIYKEGDANTVAVSKAVEKKLESIKNILPPDIKIMKVYDQSLFIQQAINEVIDAGIIGGILAIIVLYIFLRNFWSTLIISLSLPVSVIATFNLMYGTNLSLNIMSLGGIALSIGKLVDDSIVVLDNISRHREQGEDIITAARNGASQVAMAVTASTLTTVAVFFPLVFVKGIAGQLFRDQALTITFSMMVSLIVALSLIPMLASTKSGEQVVLQQKALTEPRTSFGKKLRKVRVFIFSTLPSSIFRSVFIVFSAISRFLRFILNPFLNIFTKFYSRIEEGYPHLIGWSLDHKGSVLGIAVALFAATVGMVPYLGVELIPQLSQGEFKIEFRLPPGTPLESTDKAIAEIQSSAKAINKIKLLFAVAGSGNRFDANPEQGGENWGELNVGMIPGSRKPDEEAVMTQIRKDLEAVPGLQYKFYRPTYFSFKTPVEVEISGFDLNILKKVSTEITQKMRNTDRFTDIKSSMELGHPEIQIFFDRERSAALGLNVYDIADRVVKKVRGEVATRYTWHDRKIDVLVRVQEKDRESVENIRELIINTQSDQPIPLKAVADIVVGTGPSEIRRVNQERVALISANLKYGDLGAAATVLTGIINQIEMPPDLSASVSGQNEEMNVSFRSLKFALLLAMFLVYLIMAAEFESFLHPFVIMFSIPLAFIGAVFALLITHSQVNVVVFLGGIILIGIVVNNAIVLLDFVKQFRVQGMDKRTALIKAGRSRLRPIIMTTLTTILGLVPLALGIGEGAEVRAPMAITVIGGLAVSTLLTLVVIPVVYSILDRKQ